MKIHECEHVQLENIVITILLSLVLFTGVADAAEVYKCQNESGKTVYQQGPCPDDLDAEPMNLKQPSQERLTRMYREEKLREMDWQVYKKMQADKRELARRIQDQEDRRARLEQLDAEYAQSLYEYRRSQAAYQEWLECERATSVRVGTPCYRQKTGR